MPYNLSLPGYMKEADLKAVEKLAETVPQEGIIVEVGSFLGRSAWAFSKSARAGVQVYCIDLWEYSDGDEYTRELMDGDKDDMEISFDTFLKNTADCKNIIPIKGNSTSLDWKAGDVDLAFIDGDHKSPQVDEDVNFWYGKLKKGGILCGHDFNIQVFPEVVRAVLRLSEKTGLPIVLFKDTYVWALGEHPSLKPYVRTINSVISDQIKEQLREKIDL